MFVEIMLGILLIVLFCAFAYLSIGFIVACSISILQSISDHHLPPRTRKEMQNMVRNFFHWVFFWPEPIWVIIFSWYDRMKGRT